MNQPPPLPRDQRRTDADHLRLLSIFHFVGAGLSFLGILFLVAHYTIMRTVMSDPRIWQGQTLLPSPAEIMPIFSWFYLVLAIVLIGLGIVNLLSGFFIGSRSHRLFSLIVAGANCLHFPLGTALGVFSFIVLMRDSVRDLYEVQPSFPANASQPPS